VLAVAGFALFLCYPVAFELGASGRTPGKRWSSLRVVCDDGSAITFRASALRNLVRLVDAIPGFYFVGAVAIFASRNNQRLGDLAAGTIVVREPRAAKGAPPAAELTEEAGIADLPAWDVSGLRPAEVATLRRFLERRHELDRVPRDLLARDLAERLRPSVGGMGAEVPPERFLELIAALRRIRS
jgi:RDD family